MSGWNIVSLAAVAPSPWKNGGGVTRELVAHPEVQGWSWRLSVAEIAQSGPFSRYEGVRRWLAVLAGGGVSLAIGEGAGAVTHALTPDGAPLAFSGEAPAYGAVQAGPTQDFNLMVRGETPARLARVRGACAESIDNEKIIAIFAVGEGAQVRCDGADLALAADTLAWRRCAAGARLEVAAAHALWVEIG